MQKYRQQKFTGRQSFSSHYLMTKGTKETACSSVPTTSLLLHCHVLPTTMPSQKQRIELFGLGSTSLALSQPFSRCSTPIFDTGKENCFCSWTPLLKRSFVFGKKALFFNVDDT